MDLPDECRQMGMRRPPQIKSDAVKRRLCSGGWPCRWQERWLARLVVAQRGRRSDGRGGKYKGESRYGFVAKIDMHLKIVDKRILRTAIVGNAALRCRLMLLGTKSQRRHHFRLRCGCACKDLHRQQTDQQEYQESLHRSGKPRP